MQEKLNKISEQLRMDSLIWKLNEGKTLTLKELFMLQNSLSKKIEKLVLE